MRPENRGRSHFVIYWVTGTTPVGRVGLADNNRVCCPVILWTFSEYTQSFVCWPKDLKKIMDWESFSGRSFLVTFLPSSSTSLLGVKWEVTGLTGFYVRSEFNVIEPNDGYVCQWSLSCEKPMLHGWVSSTERGLPSTGFCFLYQRTFRRGLTYLFDQSPGRRSGLFLRTSLPSRVTCRHPSLESEEGEGK